MADQIPTTGKSLKELSESTARQLAHGTKPQTVINRLVARGWPEATARQFVANARRTLDAFSVDTVEQDERQRRVRQYQRRIVRGLVCMIVGLVLIVVSLGMHNVSSGIYHFAMGVLLTVFESLDFITGMTSWWRHRRE